jgi:DNA polymerase/3'-5' exonuclease PolX
MKEAKLLVEKKRYPYEEIERVALETKEQLAPFCSRIEIVGSIRRRRADPSDIDICLILKSDDIGKFQEGIAKVINQWVKIKGALPCKYTQRLLPDAKKLDLYFATEQNWGNLVAIRTGSCEYSKFLAKRWVALGYTSIDGFLTKGGQRVEVREEKDLFRLIGVPYVEPELRNM